MIPFPAPIVEAYRQSGALDIPCPHCQAVEGNYCTREDGRVRSAPCVSRCRVKGGPPESLDPETGSEPAGGRSAPATDHLVHDPSEPRHQREDI
jgi:hypothetical protein